jgi:hypothetical protein
MTIWIYLLGSSGVICWLVAGLRPYPDFAPCFSAFAASSLNTLAGAACFLAFTRSALFFARSSTSPCADRG